MMRKGKKYLGILLSLITIMSMSTSVWAAYESEMVEPRGVYIRECVGYEPNYTEINYTHEFLGSVSGDNTNGSSVLQITYVYEESGSITASIGGYIKGTAEAELVMAKMKSEVGMEVSYTRSWTKGRAAGASYGIQPGKFEVLNVYIPAIKTAGRLKYKVYMDSNPGNVFYEYKTLSESFAPRKNSVHYKVTASSKSAIELSRGMLVYTPTGCYEVQ